MRIKFLLAIWFGILCGGCELIAQEPPSCPCKCGCFASGVCVCSQGQMAHQKMPRAVQSCENGVCRMIPAQASNAAACAACGGPGMIVIGSQGYYGETRQRRGLFHRLRGRRVGRCGK